MRILSRLISVGICSGLLFGCNAFDSGEEAVLVDPGVGVIDRVNVPNQTFAQPSRNNGFTVNQTTVMQSGFPEATVDPNSTVGKYQLGPSYNLNGRLITPREDFNYNQTGVAGWYGDGFEGATTANGEKLNNQLRTFAHRTLPFGTIARITNLDNGRSAIARVNDRGPIQADRLIDVTSRLANELGFNNAGRAQVRIQVLAEDTQRVATLTGTRNSASSANLGGFTAPSSQTAIVRQPISTETLVNTVVQPLAAPRPIPSNTAIAQVNTVQQPGGALSGVYVQAGSFAEQANAIRLKSILDPAGSVRIDPVSVSGRSLWRVSVGPYRSEGEARIALGRIVALGATDAIIRTW